MSKFIFIGDCHLKATSPISRKDNYSETILKKLEFIQSYAEKNNVSALFFLGDIFDSVNTSLQYFSFCLSLFKRIKESGIRVYTIVGNHDIRYDSMETLPVTPLGVLIKSEVMTLLTDEIVEDIHLVGCSYPEKPNKNEIKDKYSILLLHRFYEAGFNEEPITEQQVKNLEYNTYILGHDHRPYPTKVIETPDSTIKVIRPGSLARNSSDQFNRIRKPRILVFDSETLNFSYEEVPSESGQDVFIDRPEDQPVSMRELVDYLQSSYHSSNLSLREYVDTADIQEDVRSLVKSYLDILGA